MELRHVDDFKQWLIDNPDAQEFEVARQIWLLSHKLAGRYQPWPNCKLCGCRPPGTVMIHDELWLSIANKEDVLCHHCIEQLLERPLTFSDLKPCGATDMLRFGARMALISAPSSSPVRTSGSQPANEGSNPSGVTALFVDRT